MLTVWRPGLVPKNVSPLDWTFMVTLLLLSSGALLSMSRGECPVSSQHCTAGPVLMSS